MTLSSCSGKTCKELISICKDLSIRGYSGKKKGEIISLILSECDVRSSGSRPFESRPFDSRPSDSRSSDSRPSDSRSSDSRPSESVPTIVSSGVVLTKGSPLKVLSLFSGCGGLDYGFHKNPIFQVIKSYDSMKHAVDTYNLNFTPPSEQ